jgi:hypothetical protein
MAETKRIRQKPSSKLVKAKNSTLAYDKIDSFEFKQSNDPFSICTLDELVKLLENDSTVDVDADIYAVGPDGKAQRVILNKKAFLEQYKKNSTKTNFRESIDWFATDIEMPITNSIGNDFVPLLGGPFNRQQYLNSMLQGHQQAFFAYHHDPIAREAINIIKNFTLGRDFRVDCDDEKALILWRAFEEATDLKRQIEYICIELALYGEVFINWLPDGETKFTYNISPGQESPKGVLPRFKLVDPSTVWEVLTYPEDMTRVLGYQLVYPTQYSLYTTKDAGKPVPSTKFIYKQLPPNQVDHFKINCVSNEKRGRSDLYPIFGYLKRLRDSINYSIIGLQKTTAWSIDTIVDGSQTDIDNYIQAQNDIGTIAPPGSEFVHSKKIERKYMSNEGSSKGGQSAAFDWCMSMICAGLGIPMQYFGTHMSGQGTRGNALVATEPVAKKFEGRQVVLENIIKKMAKRLFDQFGIDADIEVTFPDIVTQDRSAKLKDLATAQSMGWISKERAANIAAKELGITDFDYSIENTDQEQQSPGEQSPLTAPPAAAQDVEKTSSPSGISSQDRRQTNLRRGF